MPLPVFVTTEAARTTILPPPSYRTFLQALAWGQATSCYAMFLHHNHYTVLHCTDPDRQRNISLC